MSDFKIRQALMGDLQACLEIDGSYVTDHVWQMESHTADGRITVSFRTVRLPRSMRVAYPRQPEALAADWRMRDGFLIAERGTEKLGYASLGAQAALSQVHVGDLVVSRAHRRTGVGSALIGAAMRWGRERGLKQIVAEVQTKNHPAISMLNKLGFVFCGFNDRHFLNQDIAIFFSRAVR
ncbi:MAG TPA: GNAT family N-acetyltransferase [Anaerolineae bacterium]|nr:GNAT family N-acetyltransferase [Anaerolineae bacterium]